ncbi:type II toxin-antitoxin system VapC family toxin [Prauserella oleivorans]|uniref:Ribonuclease VapC n=1 Tax=Prauserella oleivorans TaxID=1478153 RepID=A0ABW5W2R4_9PSEU
MIAYFDTSGFVPLVIAEPGSETCRRIWNEADAVVTSRLLFVEAAAALAQAQRLGRLTTTDRAAALTLLGRLWRELDIVEVDEPVVARAAELAASCALRGYDAVHCASAEQLLDPDLVFVSGDRRLLRACAGLGMAIADTSEERMES